MHSLNESHTAATVTQLAELPDEADVTQPSNLLGQYLKARRERLDPRDFGFVVGRRRTPGLRREEVAQLACVSPTWYTWLEQGRGGAPSGEVVERLSRALRLTEVEREHLFLLALNRPPEVSFQGPGAITEALQKMLEALSPNAVIIKTALWDVVGWNKAARVLLTDYEQLPVRDRNVLRMIFIGPARARMLNWEAVAQMAVETFRREIAQSGARADAQALIAELSESSEEFRHLWAQTDVRAYGQGQKLICHPELGSLCFDYASFSVDGQPELGMVVYSPSSTEDKAKAGRLLAEKLPNL
ncbi:helix-turn-helix transcriptional regulator [Pokkaliibacter sp. CJK22405]|uniref:helix-turn-helix transcriptional regulator n=1 Tax=Pokkaliibacter sp. CJK22405 TaxID=3384615 RepID=UPI003984C92E